LLKITEARSKAASVNVSSNVSADEFNQQSVAQNELAAATNNLIIRIEKYPTLKGTAAYSGLQTQLEGTERRIKVARQDFNAAINDYNNSVRRFPTNVAAGILGFKVKSGFQSDAGTNRSIEIKF
jgi:LemA protein